MSITSIDIIANIYENLLKSPQVKTYKDGSTTVFEIIGMVDWNNNSNIYVQNYITDPGLHTSLHKYMFHDNIHRSYCQYQLRIDTIHSLQYRDEWVKLLTNELYNFIGYEKCTEWKIMISKFLN